MAPPGPVKQRLTPWEKRSEESGEHHHHHQQQQQQQQEQQPQPQPQIGAVIWILCAVSVAYVTLAGGILYIILYDIRNYIIFKRSAAYCTSRMEQHTVLLGMPLFEAHIPEVYMKIPSWESRMDSNPLKTTQANWSIYQVASNKKSTNYIPWMLGWYIYMRPGMILMT